MFIRQRSRMRYMSQVLVFVMSFWFAFKVSAEKDLVLEYNFDEGATTIVNDSSSKNNNGILRGGPKWTKGVSGTALDLNGTDTYVEVPASISLDIDDATIEGWFFIRKIGGGIGFITGPSWVDYRLILHFTLFEGVLTQKIKLTISDGKDINKVINISGTSDLPLNKWCHIAVSCDGVEMKIYLNGTLEAKHTQGIISVTKGVDFIIGKTIGLDPVFFDGMIDELRIYNRALTANEIAIRAKKYNPEDSLGKKYKATVKSESIPAFNPVEYALKWLREPGSGALIISHSILPHFYYKKEVLLSESDFLTATGLPGNGQKIKISKVKSVAPEFGYLTNLDWKNIEVSKVEDVFLKREGVSVLAWGETNSGSAKTTLIPVALSIKTMLNKEVIYFPWQINYSYYGQVSAFRAVLDYLKRQNIDIAPGVVYSVTTKQDNMERSGRVVTSKEELEQLIIPAFLCLNGQPVILSINVSNGPLKLVEMEVRGNSVKGALYSSRGFVAASVGRTFFAAGGQFCSINNRVYATTYELVPYAMSTMDGEEYHYTLGLDLLVGEEGNVYIMRPEFWANDEQISAFYLDAEKMHRDKLILDKAIIQIKVQPGRYFLVYGAPDAGFSNVAEFVKWFGKRIKQGSRPDESVPVFETITTITKMSNVIWITIVKDI